MIRAGVVFAATMMSIAADGGSAVGVPATKTGDKPPPAPPGCAPAAFLTFESGRLEGVDWVERHGSQVHTRAIRTQSIAIDATIDIRPDQTSAHSSVVIQTAGGVDGKPTVRDLSADSIYWSDFIVSSVEQAVARARVLNQPTVSIPGASLFTDTHADLLVNRLDATNWIVSVHNKRYEVLTDENGCMEAAILPDYGVVIERRSYFPVDQYPLWAPYAAPPDGAYRAVDVSIDAPQGRVLAGTLTTPLSLKVVPAALLITGLSANDRNNGQPPWMPLRDFADALTRAGIAVLRVDDRGVGKSTGDNASMTTFDKAEDVRTEVAWLRTQPGLDATQIVLIGYSEGGLIAPMVAASDKAIAAIVTLAGPGVPGLELARYQIQQLVLHDPTIAAADREKEIAKQLSGELTPREQSFLSIDPIDFVRRVHCPALIIQGGADLHVPVRSTERLAAAMRAAGNSAVTVRIIPGVSHSLLPDPIGPQSGWVYLPGVLTSPSILDETVQWVTSKLHPAI
jgi:pimeloyl-ACP methyl ester carboxylesterase